jgi:hypothetical protein
VEFLLAEFEQKAGHFFALKEIDCERQAPKPPANHNMTLGTFYPTREHEAAAKSFVRFVTSNFEADAVLLVNSCTRGKATRDSCLDIVLLASPAKLSGQLRSLQKEWLRFQETDPAILALRRVGLYSEVHADFVDGAFAPVERDETGGPDSFEVEIGNFLAYSVPLWESGDYYSTLKRKWLPYYDDQLRGERLNEVRRFCLNSLHHIAPYVHRGLYFQAFDRLYDGYREFLQALFITSRTYPIAYNKWIKEQVEDILGLAELYARLPRLFEIQRFESLELVGKAEEVEALLHEYAPALAPKDGERS